MIAHEGNFPLELSYIALRRNSAKANSGAVLSLFWFAFAAIFDFHME